MELYATRGSDGFFYAAFYGATTTTQHPDKVQWFGTREEAKRAPHDRAYALFLPPNSQVVKYRLEEVTE